jgi:hypothetical protein
MVNRLVPAVGRWYDPLDKGGLFQVVAIDQDSKTIEIQEFDGNLDEVDFDEWRQMMVEEAAPPEDWTGPVDDVEADDLGYSDVPAEEGLSEPIENLVATWDETEQEDEVLEDQPPVLPRRPDRAGHGR